MAKQDLSRLAKNEYREMMDKCRFIHKWLNEFANGWRKWLNKCDSKESSKGQGYFICQSG